MQFLKFATVLVLVASTASPALTQEPTLPPTAPDGSYQPAPEEQASDNPVTAIGQVDAALAAVLGQRGLPAAVAGRVRTALGQCEKALAAFVDIESNLMATVRHIQVAEQDLRRAREATRDPALGRTLEAQQVRLAGVARQIADGLLRRAVAAGVDPVHTTPAQNSMLAGDGLAAQGDYDGAVNYYGQVLPIKNALVFNPVRFRAVLHSALDAEAIGYAVAVVRNGQLVEHDTFANGDWRTLPDLPQMWASVDKEMNIASVTKTITATAVLHLMKQRGISVDDQIGPYLPWNWARGFGVNQITFRMLMTHRSGLFNNASDGETDFESLKTFVATSITLEKTGGLYPFKYQNGNFALFRVILANLDGACNTSQDGCLPADQIQNDLALYYRNYVQCQILHPMGLSPDEPGNDADGCGGPDLKPEAGDRVRYYWEPNPSIPSWESSDWTYYAGGGGWHFTARELAQFLAHLRYDDNILDPETRTLMYTSFLGWNHPDLYDFSSGIFGTYRMHGGDLYTKVPDPNSNTILTPGLRTAIADFPDGTQAVLLINSRGGAHLYQCALLKQAYENAWEKK